MSELEKTRAAILLSALVLTMTAFALSNGGSEQEVAHLGEMVVSATRLPAPLGHLVVSATRLPQEPVPAARLAKASTADAR